MKRKTLNPKIAECEKVYPDFIGTVALSRVIFPISKKLNLFSLTKLTLGGIKCITPVSIFINLLLT